MKIKFLIYFAIILFLGSSCASSYKNINTSNVNYINKQTIAGFMEVGYKYDIYASTSNKKYSKKEKKFGYKTVAVEIRNISSIPILITQENFKIYVGETQIQPVNLSSYLMTVKQSSGLYLLHALWGPWRVETWSDSYGASGGKVTYIPIGLAVGIINALVSGSANKRHATNIQELYIFNKTIEPNEKLSGIICLDYDSFDQLTFKYLE